MIRHDVTMMTSVSNQRESSGLNVGKVSIAVGSALAVGVFLYFDLGRFLSLTALKENRDRLLACTDANFAGAVGIFILTYAVVTGLSLPGAVILTLAGGFLFGAVSATLFVNVGAATGATLAFLTARYLLRDTVEQKVGKWLGPFQEGFAKNAFSYLLTLSGLQRNRCDASCID